MLIRKMLCITALLCAQLSVANAQSADSLAIYQNSSAEIRVEQFSSQIASQFSGIVSNVASSDTYVHPLINSAIESVYNPRHFEKHILRAIDSTLNWQERRKIIAWLDTPLGRKASLAEAMALMKANRDGMSSTIEKARGLDSESKVALVNIVELAAMESALQLDISVFQTSVSAFAANAPQSGLAAGDYQVFKRAADSRRNEVASLNRNYTRSLLGLAYADFSKAEVKALISFWGSPTGTRYSVALRRGITNAFIEANGTFNSMIKQIVNASTVASAE